MGLRPGKVTNDPNGYFAIGAQSAKGTEAATFQFLRHLDGSSMEVERSIKRVREGGDGQEVGLSYTTRATADGQANANGRPVLTALLVGGALGIGTSATFGAAGVLQRNTYWPGASQPYFSVEQRFADEIERALDCVVNGFTITGEAGEPWTISAPFINGGSIFQRDVASTLTPSRELGRPFFYPGGSYIFDGAASYAADFTKIEVQVERAVDEDIQTTGITRDDVVSQNLDVTVRGTLKYTSRDFYRAVKYNGGSTLRTLLPTGSVDLTSYQMVEHTAGTSAATGLMRVQLPLIEWTDAKVNKLDPDGKTMYLDVVGQNIKGATHAIIVDVTVPSGAAGGIVFG